MRPKDYKKKKAIFNATIKLVNDMGFSACTVSKIAKEAGISVGTLYLYYKNKDDVIVSAFLKIKRKMGKVLFRGVSETLAFRNNLNRMWRNMFDYVKSNRNEFYFTELVSNSHYGKMIDKEKVDKYFEPLNNVVRMGVEQRFIKNVHSDILASFMLFPVQALAGTNLRNDIELNDANVDTAFQLAWDAIKI